MKRKQAPPARKFEVTVRETRAGGMVKDATVEVAGDDEAAVRNCAQRLAVKAMFGLTAYCEGGYVWHRAPGLKPEVVTTRVMVEIKEMT